MGTGVSIYKPNKPYSYEIQLKKKTFSFLAANSEFLASRHLYTFFLPREGFFYLAISFHSKSYNEYIRLLFLVGDDSRRTRFFCFQAARTVNIFYFAYRAMSCSSGVALPTHSTVIILKILTGTPTAICSARGDA